jgi:antitoxin (DNA-binding transcriptional repressor) of toxin-antitoxin stability system
MGRAASSAAWGSCRRNRLAASAPPVCSQQLASALPIKGREAERTIRALKSTANSGRLARLSQEAPVPTYNVLEAKSNLSRLIAAVESGRESEIVIARNGKPAAKLVRVDIKPAGKRLGIAEGLFEVPEDIDQDNEYIEKLFNGEFD